MKVTSISYVKTFQVDERMWVKLGLTGEIEPTDNTQESIKKLESEVNEYFKAVLPKPPTKPSLIPKKKESIEESTIRAITGCTDINILKTFEKLAKNYPSVQAEYDKILKTLQ